MKRINKVEVLIGGKLFVEKKQNSDLVIIRTYSAGVHIGVISERDGMNVTLNQSRRLWRWRGANTLNEVAVKGVVRSEYTRISEFVDGVEVTAIEIIPVSEEAAKTLEAVWNN